MFLTQFNIIKLCTCNTNDVRNSLFNANINFNLLIFEFQKIDNKYYFHIRRRKSKILVAIDSMLAKQLILKIKIVERQMFLMIKTKKFLIKI